MRQSLLRILVCPTCQGSLACDPREIDSSAEVIEGVLRCQNCSAEYPITNAIPRFVPSSNYAASFGYQWNKFRQEQIDSLNGIRQSEHRFYSETGWTAESLRGKWILDVGCGAGRFLEVASRADCEVVGVDISNAVDAARENLKRRENVHLVQASIYELPFAQGSFDGCYCIGVIQHTPEPAASIRALPKMLKEGGELAVTIYERRRWTLANSKYFVRRVTSRMNPKLLLWAIRVSMPLAFPITEALFRIPKLGRFFQFTIPIANYVNDPELDMRQRYQWAILDTFDMLAPRYDQPQTEQVVRAILESEQVVSLRRLRNPGLNLVGVRSSGSGVLVDAGR